MFLRFLLLFGLFWGNHVVNGQAAMTIDVTGVPGSVETLWILAGRSESISNSLIHTDTSNHFPGDSATMRASEQAGGNYINDGAFDWGVPFLGHWVNTIGTDPIDSDDILIQPRIMVGEISRMIFSIAHQDRSVFDSLGIRVTPTALHYLVGDSSELSGVFTLPIDISSFVPGVYLNKDGSSESTGLEFTTPGDFELRIYGQTAFSDYGDAPLSYGTLFVDDGARHTPIGPILGLNRDSELNGFATSNADGDDQIGTPDDEDGIAIVPQAGFDRNSGVSNSVTLTVLGAPAEYEIWIDWNSDGVFANPGELAASGTLATDGLHSIAIAVPGFANVGATFLRARVYAVGEAIGLPDGLALSGEVEDHEIAVQDTTFLRLTSFEAKTTEANTIELVWKTSSESNVSGFNVWQESLISSEPRSRRKANSILIPSKGIGLSGAEYRLELDPGYGHYSFELEEIETSGISVSHGSVTVAILPRVSVSKKNANTLAFVVQPRANWEYRLQSAILGNSASLSWESEDALFDRRGIATVRIDPMQDKVFRVSVIASN